MDSRSWSLDHALCGQVMTLPNQTGWGELSDAPLGHGLRGLVGRVRSTQSSSEAKWGVALTELDMRESG